MDDTSLNISALFEKITDLGKTSIELIKLKAIDKTAQVASSLIALIVFWIFGSLVFVLLNIGAALLLGSALGSAAYGFIALAAFYSLIALLYKVFLSKLTQRSIQNFIIKQWLT